MAETLEKKSLGSKIFTLVILVVVYLVVAIPFETLNIMPGFANIRPLEVLEPIYGIFFGLPGCIIMGLCNLIMDIISDSVKLSSIEGFLANIMGPLCFYIYWTYISKTDFDLRSFRNILKQIGVTVFSGVLEAAMITPAVAYFYPHENFVEFAGIVLLNDIAFPTLLGIPVIILMQEELGFKPCERKH